MAGAEGKTSELRFAISLPCVAPMDNETPRKRSVKLQNFQPIRIPAPERRLEESLNFLNPFIVRPWSHSHTA